MKKNLPAIICILITIAFAVVSYFVLPAEVTTQISLNDSATTMPKIFAILIPTILGLIGAIMSFCQKEKTKKSLIISGVAILVFILMLVVNL